MDLSIVIVNYKSEEKTLACLNAIKAGDMSGLKYEIIVVDNASGDEMRDVLRLHKDIYFKRSSQNLGMGGGNNYGIKDARGKYILVLNPDTLVSPKAIKTLFEYIKNHLEAGIVGPKLLNTDGSLQYSCARFPKFYTPLLRRTFVGKLGKKHLANFMMMDFGHDVIRPVDWLMGSCLMINREALQKIGGGFDESFFMYFEDIDLCRRMWKAGFKVIYNPEVVVVHDHARQSARAPWYSAPFTDKLAREHIKSWLIYFLK